MNLKDEIANMTRMHAYSVTGDERYLKGVKVDQIPCRVSAELRQHQTAQDHAEQETPDFVYGDDLNQVVRKELVSSLKQLLSTRDQALAAEGIGGIDKAKAYEWLMKDLAAFERALYAEWLAS